MIDEHRTTSFAGRAVIVTGAGSGIGRATARAFAAAGADVLAVGRRPDALAETAGDYPSIVPFPTDLRDEGAGSAIVAEALARWRRLDVLVNNAGVFTAMPLAEVTAARVNELVATNLTAPSLLAAAALAPLREQGGSIINVSSTFGHRPVAGAGHYAATKAAIEQLTRSWALELAPDGIRVNAVAPGPTESGALAAAGLPEAVIAQVKAEETARIPLGRRGEPGEVADWIVRLADPAAWVTGQVLAVDGGLGLT
ncbi:MAG TPA: SDR family oxidoreductase [Pseudonocardia sp.]|jgi:NAD(P)-dependent dehydrogenase (short-subunit alcohol dehydrogenase family)|nr:SDR family oxidoreductase [Pseudonocardia sp.]